VQCLANREYGAAREQQGVAVRRSAGDAGRADLAAGTADVFDDEWLAEQFSSSLAKRKVSEPAA